MVTVAKVSICIPTYKQPQFFKRLLDSIVHQKYKNIEVIVSDDSPDLSIKNIVDEFVTLLDIKYYPHNPALKTPRNWNFALDKASGDFLLLMHHDDWFAQEESVEKYVSKFVDNKELDFIFSKNNPINLDGSVVKKDTRYRMIKNLAHEYDILIHTYIVGPPSNIMVRNTVTTRYDEEFIWLVDVDYCVRTIKNGYKVGYIDEVLVNIGMHPEQTTTYCNENPHIVLKENVLYLFKLSKQRLRNIKLYDYFWRLFRNHNVRNLEQLYAVGVDKERIHPVVNNIISFQKRIPNKWLKMGILSKSLMFLNYIKFHCS